MDRKKYFVVLIFLAAVFVSYGSTLTGTFIWDDNPLILDNPLVKNTSTLHKIFTTELYDGSGVNYYRPILTLSFALNFLISKFNPFGYHLVNILLHFCAGYLLYVFLASLGIKNSVSFFSSLLFLIHPIHGQTVSYISGRADSLAAIFVLSSLLFYLRGRSLYFSIGFFILGLLSREIAAVLPLIIIILERIYRRAREGVGKKVLPFFLALTGYLSLRFTLLDFSGGNPILGKKGFAWFEVGFFTRFYLFLKSLVIYLGSFFVPVNLHMDRYLFYEKIYPQYWAGFVICLLLSLFIIKKSSIFKDSVQSSFKFFLAWFFVWLLPQSAFVFPRIMAEHFLYLSSIYMFFILALCIDSIDSQFLKKLCLVSVFLYFILFSWQNNRYWLDELTFFKRTAHLSPTSIRARDSLASIYLSQSRYDEAEHQYFDILDLIRRYPQRGDTDIAKSATMHNIGVLFDKTGRKEEALSAYLSAIKINPKMKESYNNAGLIYQELGQAVNAEACFGSAISLDAGFYQAMNNLAVLYAQEGRVSEAESLWESVLLKAPDYESAKLNLALIREGEDK